MDDEEKDQTGTEKDQVGTSSGKDQDGGKKQGEDTGTDANIDNGAVTAQPADKAI